MTRRPLLVIVLAAGKGTRMRSAMPKVLHKIAGRSMLSHVLALATPIRSDRVAVVVGPGMEDVTAEAQSVAPGAEIFVQESQRGTADAVLAARKAILAHKGDVLVLYADTPLLEAESVERLLGALDGGADMAVAGFETENPGAYGRLLLAPDGALVAIREAKDASESELRTRLCNSGVMAFRLDDLETLLASIGNANAKREFYLTDAVEIVCARGGKAAAVTCSEDEVLGINARDGLAAAEEIWQRRVRARVMAGGATLIAPETVWLSWDTVIGRDVLIEPNVFFGPGVTVEDGVIIHAFSHLERARVRAGSELGPFARLRPGADVGPNAKVGNFVEIKNSRLEDGAKANHLSYIGDGHVGARANIGAGTIFCNYDGFMKHKTEIGAGAFVGSNTALVAPVKIGAGAYIGSGSVITRDVEPDALALERGPQEERPQWAAKFRALMAKRKAKSG
jgi:bifunctional UDP-N-acetylglucosamine pyrophosphorylase / glucosamine-1-phosphate N-acetyltransferase